MSDSAKRPEAQRTPAFIACAEIFGVYFPPLLVAWDVVSEAECDRNRRFKTPERRLGK